jgi:hypothetical protein
MMKFIRLRHDIFSGGQRFAYAHSTGNAERSLDGVCNPVRNVYNRNHRCPPPNLVIFVTSSQEFNSAQPTSYLT